jgi:hypothetical protein
VGQQVSISEEFPPLDEEGQLELVPEEVLEQRERRLKSRVIRECLVRWRGTSNGGCHMGGRAYIAAPRIDVA